MQLAEDRVRVLTAVDDMRAHAGACAKSLYLHNSVVRKALVALSSASMATLSFLVFRKKEKADTPRVSSGVGAGRYFSAKLATAVLIPWLRKVLVGAEPARPCKKGIFHKLISRS
ncbi:MAG: hypothetical protein IKV92_03000 [Akkermansia sp.]|jgi:hypothetical protein|nr:hypothetical protein [Akkermansia sp.]MBR5876184.1 hypothetical protein [Akkermansia sp.]